MTPVHTPQTKAANRLTVPIALTLGMLVLNLAFAGMEVYVSFWFETLTFDQLDTIAEIEQWALPIVLATALVFLIWSFLAHSNLDSFGRSNQVHSHQATIWWWLVPIANLFMPFRVMFETSRGSTAVQGDAIWRSESVMGSVYAWTGLFISGFIARGIASSSLEQAFTDAAVERALTINGVAYLVTGGAAIAAIVMVWQVTDSQKALAAMWLPQREGDFGGRTETHDPRSRFLGEVDQEMAHSNVFDGAPAGSGVPMVDSNSAVSGHVPPLDEHEAKDLERRLSKLGELHRRGVITDAEHAQRRRDIINEI